MEAQEFYRKKRDALIKEFESFRANPYLDSEGIPTIGYGTTSYPDGRKVTMNDSPVTQDVADTYFQHHVDQFSDHISKAPGFNQLDEATKAGLLLLPTTPDLMCLLPHVAMKHCRVLYVQVISKVLLMQSSYITTVVILVYCVVVKLRLT